MMTLSGMGEPGTALLSVRGEARTTVAPDLAVLDGALKVTGETKAEALNVATAGLRELTEALALLGGLPHSVESERHPLTWSARSTTTEEEHETDAQTGLYRLTGRAIASVALQLAVRDFDLLDRLGAVLAVHNAVHVHFVSWQADPDNPAWPEVRASAIRAAINKGRDYAAALGGALIRVEHIADVGLLGGDTDTPVRAAAFTGRVAAMGSPEVPSLNPVPQELVAVIDARFVAVVAAL